MNATRSTTVILITADNMNILYWLLLILGLLETEDPVFISEFNENDEWIITDDTF